MGGGPSKEEIQQQINTSIQGAFAQDSSSSSGIHLIEIHTASAVHGSWMLLVGLLATIGVIALLVGAYIWWV